MNKIKQAIISALILLATTFSINTVMAHGGGQAINGGVVEVLGDVAFELVVLEESVELYVVDDGVEIPVDKMKAKLKVKNGDMKSELVLKPAGGNRFAATGATIASGAEVAAVVTREDGYSRIIMNFIVE